MGKRVWFSAAMTFSGWRVSLGKVWTYKSTLRVDAVPQRWGEQTDLYEPHLVREAWGRRV